MGVSGCGKSLVAKVLAREWRVPLFRLDMNRVFSGAYGNPEATFHRALRTVESLAPVVLWIDEIENGLGFTGPGTTHLFSAFLTWMQEKPPLVFVAATANRIEDLPAEMIRKGRFDQVFFVDLPDAGERRELLEIHLARQATDPAAFDLVALVRDTDGWNAAEIEQAVIAARTQGLHEARPFNSADLRAVARRVVPLSRTMSEQIKTLRDWAWDRATPASRGKGTDAVTLGDEELA
jgi:SpoVK/Ycf46/Vps4 family AAA+-type ATPase